MKKKFLFLLLLFAFMIPSSFALNPSRTYKQRPEKYNMEYKEHKVPTNDEKASLNCWYFPAKTKTTRLILISHNGEGNMADYLRRVDQFRSDYNVVTYDYRGYGTSSEFEIDNNMYIYPHFQDDMESMIDFCRKQFTQTFHMYGWGIGAGLSLGVGWHRHEVKRIIADTPFLSMEDLEERFSSWEEPMEVPFAGYEKRFEPIHSLEHTPGKNLKGVLLIIGSNDILFSKKDMYALTEKAPDAKMEIYIVENPDRKDNFRADKTNYGAMMRKFLSL